MVAAAIDRPHEILRFNPEQEYRRLVENLHMRKTDMNEINFVRWLAAYLALLVLLTGCQTASETVKPEREKDAVTMGKTGVQAPKTLAIFPFENNSVTDPAQYDPLRKGLCAMLITDLNKSGSTLKLIERSKIESLLKEIALGQAGGIDESTAVQVGKILGAQSIAFGSFMVLGTQVRMDVRVIKVETSELIVSESITGSSDDFMALETQLAEKIAKSLRVAFIPATMGSASDMNAALVFSQGLDALDRGDRDEADRLFAKTIELDPAFQSRVEAIKGVQ